jgi:hypothetical protein
MDPNAQTLRTRMLYHRSADALGFFNQHDRDVILDRIPQLAGFAYQTILFIGEMQFAFAFWTREDIQ